MRVLHTETGGKKIAMVFADAEAGQNKGPFARLPGPRGKVFHSVSVDSLQ